MCFCAARLIRNAPRRCTPSTVSQSFSVILNRRLSRITPALLTRTTGGPSSAATLPTAASTWSAWLTSAPTANARPPAAVIASTVPAQVAPSRSSTATALPSPASLRAVAAPMPRAAPVTMATRCASCAMLSLLLFFLFLGYQSLAGADGPAGRPARGAASGRAGRVHGRCCRVRRRRGPRRRGSAGHALAAVQVGPQLPARQRALVHLVGPVGEPQRAGGRPQVRQREILADPGRAVRLDRLVDHPFGHGR